MQVILKLDIKGLGNKNDIVDVKPGYGRNYLIPKKFAIIASLSNKKNITKNIKYLENKNIKVYKSFKNLAVKISKINIEIFTKISEKKKFFGSITITQILDLLKLYNINLERKNLKINGVIKSTGIYKVNFFLFQNISFDLDFKVLSK